MGDARAWMDTLETYRKRRMAEEKKTCEKSWAKILAGIYANNLGTKLIEIFCTKYLGWNKKTRNWVDKNLSRFQKRLLHFAVIICYSCAAIGFSYFIGFIVTAIIRQLTLFFMICSLLVAPKLFGFAFRKWVDYKIFCKWLNEQMKTEEKGEENV